jgi:hypothetical protein
VIAFIGRAHIMSTCSASSSTCWPTEDARGEFSTDCAFL